jgi:hypothetical protein
MLVVAVTVPGATVFSYVLQQMESPYGIDSLGLTQ